MLKKMSLITIMLFCTFAFTAFKVSAFIPGYISGVVSDASTKKAIGTALIKTDAGRSAISDVNGAYTVTHEEGVFTLTVEAEDAILALKILLGVPTGTSDITGADINGDKKIGLAEAIFILQMISESKK